MSYQVWVVCDHRIDKEWAGVVAIFPYDRKTEAKAMLSSAGTLSYTLKVGMCEGGVMLVRDVAIEDKAW